jgi:hypothetical protein
MDLARDFQVQTIEIEREYGSIKDLSPEKMKDYKEQLQASLEMFIDVIVARLIGQEG